MQAYKPGSVPSQQDKSASKVPVIYLAPASRQESIDLPTLISSPRSGKRTSEQLLIRAYLIFQPIRFTMQYRSPGTRWALTPPFHPYPARRGGIFSVALAVTAPSPVRTLPVRKYGALCCPDFPLSRCSEQRQAGLHLQK